MPASASPLYQCFTEIAMTAFGNFLCLFSLTLVATLTEAKNGGFSVELIHRDSPRSPFYDPRQTHMQRVINALRRSINRPYHFSPTSISITGGAQSEIFSNQGEYLMKISIGTPPFEIHAIADTGSDLVWTQCEPCSECFKQDAPLFNPNSSSTYRELSCSSRQCRALKGTSCSSSTDTCLYSVAYGDSSFSEGNLALDTVTLDSTSGRPVALPKTIIGCGYKNKGTFSNKGSGIIGLGGGKVSLISQLGNSIRGKLSYCLVPFSEPGSPSKINFGSDAVVSGSGVVWTPLVNKNPSTFYFVTLEAISVGDDRIEFTDSSSYGTEEGNVIIDSGTTLTLLPADFYSKLESSMASKIDAERIKAPHPGLSLCYNSAQARLVVPEITVHFRNADLKLSPLNTFVPFSKKIVCFAFNRIAQSSAIYGSLAQSNFLVGYDTQAQTVSFKPTDCTKR